QRWKRELVVTALAQANIDAPVAPLVDAHGEGRRRAVFHARRGNHDIVAVGFAAARAHHIVPIDQCPILAPDMAGAIKTAWVIADLSAGFGPFALRLAESRRVLAIDSDAEAIAALNRGAATTKGLKPISAQVRDLFRRALVANELAGFAAVVFDPPRQGAQSQA